MGSIPTRTLGSSGRRDWHAPRAGPDQGSPDRTGEVARAQGQEGEPQFIFSCLECASKPYLDIRRQSELEAAGVGRREPPFPGLLLQLLFPALPLIILSGGSGAALNSSLCWRGCCPALAGWLAGFLLHLHPSSHSLQSLREIELQDPGMFFLHLLGSQIPSRNCSNLPRWLRAYVVGCDGPEFNSSIRP